MNEKRMLKIEEALEVIEEANKNIDLLVKECGYNIAMPIVLNIMGNLTKIRNKLIEATK